MDVFETMLERRTTRGFLDKPLEKEVLEKVLHLATSAPSAINLQPWEFVVVSGEERKRLSRMLVKLLKERNTSCGPAAREPLPLYFKRRQKGLLDRITPFLPDGVSFQEFINEGSCNFYGAPTVMIITIDRAFSSIHLTDIGIAIGYLVLAAHAMGLGTCPIGLVTAFGDEMKELLNMPDAKDVVISIAVGYPDPGAKINQARSERVQLSDVIKWRG